MPLMEFRSQIASPSSQTASLHRTARILYAMLQNALRVYDARKKERRNDILCVTVRQEPRDGFVVQQDVTPLCRSPDHDAGLGACQRLQADDGMFVLYHLCIYGAAWSSMHLPCLTAASRIRSSLGATLASPRQ